MEGPGNRLKVGGHKVSFAFRSSVVGVVQTCANNATETEVNTIIALCNKKQTVQTLNQSNPTHAFGVTPFLC